MAAWASPLTSTPGPLQPRSVHASRVRRALSNATAASSSHSSMTHLQGWVGVKGWGGEWCMCVGVGGGCVEGFATRPVLRRQRRMRRWVEGHACDCRSVGPCNAEARPAPSSRPAMNKHQATRPQQAAHACSTGAADSCARTPCSPHFCTRHCSSLGAALPQALTPTFLAVMRHRRKVGAAAGVGGRHLRDRCLGRVCLNTC